MGGVGWGGVGVGCGCGWGRVGWVGVGVIPPPVPGLLHLVHHRASSALTILQVF